MTQPTAHVRRTPDRTHRAADYLLPPLAVAAAAALCLFLWAPPEEQLPRTPVFFGGGLLGLLLPRLYPHRFRVLGLAPYGAAAALAVVVIAEAVGTWPPYAVGLFCGFAGVVCGAVLRHRDRFRAEPRWMAAAALLAVVLGVGTVAMFTSAGPTDPGVRGVYRWLLVGLSAWVAVQAWVTLFRPALEISAELLLGLMYRVTAAGPGLKQFPQTGPVLVIANHAAWFDPLFLAKVLPRPVTPMMTARFYNLPVLRPLLKHVVRVIVVPEAPIRREAPEVQEAIAALDVGRCVVIFPEGYLRRKEDQLLRRFGQGVWQILKARPGTPVVACWIEGAWGSYTSYHNGRPTKNKKLDLGRPIAIGVSAPEAVPADVLADHLPTRVYLMNKVLDARTHLGLPAAPPVELPGREEKEEED